MSDTSTKIQNLKSSEKWSHGLDKTFIRSGDMWNSCDTPMGTGDCVPEWTVRLYGEGGNVKSEQWSSHFTKISIKVCTGPSCKGRFSPYILKRLLAEKAKYDIGNKSTIEECGCQGSCKTWPVIVVDGTLMDRMDPVKASAFYLEKLKKS